MIVGSSADMLIDSTGGHQHIQCSSMSNSTVLQSLLGRSLGQCLGMLLCLSPAIGTCAPGSEAVLRSHHCRPQDHHQGRSLSAVATGAAQAVRCIVIRQILAHGATRPAGRVAVRHVGNMRDSCSLDSAGQTTSAQQWLQRAARSPAPHC